MVLFEVISRLFVENTGVASVLVGLVGIFIWFVRTLVSDF